MIKNPQKQTGSALLVVIIIFAVGIVGTLGFVAWNNFLAPKDGDTGIKGVSSEEKVPDPVMEYATVKINEHTFRYPLNDNNQNIINITDDSSPALQVSFAPIRSYYESKNVGSECKEYVAGLVNTSSQKELIDYSILQRYYGKDSFDQALSDDTIVQVGDKDLYLTGPFKHNELCIDIYENTDAELKATLSDIKHIRSAWLHSLELVE